MAAAHDLLQAGLLGEAVDAGPALVFVADEQMRYVAVNRRACDALGYAREELLRLRVDDVAVGEESHELYQDLLLSRSQAGETLLKRKDGSTVAFSYRACETMAGGLTSYIAIGFVDDG